MPRHSFKIYPNILVVFQGIAGVSIWLFAASHSIGQLDSLDRSTLEEFGDIPIVLSSKNPTQLFEAPVGSFVFDEAAIDSIAEMLRYAPDVHVIRPSNGIWGGGLRGINSRFFYRVGFIDFVQWESDFTSNPATIAVLSDQDLCKKLRRIARDQLRSRKLEIIHLKPGTQPPSRESTFSLSRRVKRTINKRLKDIAWKRGFCQPEKNGFTEDGGAIQFVYRKNRLRFIVNQDNANRQGIVLDSKLIELSVDER